MAKLPLPLHCYSEAGRLQPSSWFHLAIFWGARAPLIIAASFMIGPRGDAIPTLFIPLPWQLTAHVILGFLFIALWLVVGRRNWLWSRGQSLRGLGPVLLALVCADIGIQGIAIADGAGSFSWLKGLTLLVSSFSLFYLLRSKRTRLMFADWSAPE